MINVLRFHKPINELHAVLKQARTVLLTAPEISDGDSIGSQLALRIMIQQHYPQAAVWILNDQPVPERYLFMPDIEQIHTPETFAEAGGPKQFDVAIIVDGGVERAGRLKEIFCRVPVRVFIDHHAVSGDHEYSIRIVEPTASSTTELIFHLSQNSPFHTFVTTEFAQNIYLGLVFDTGFFRHANTTPQVLELAGTLVKTGFDFTRVGERGMLERSFASLKLMSHTVSKAELRAGGKIIYSVLTQETLKSFNAIDDDREGIIDHLFLTRGIEVAVLMLELPDGTTKVSFRSQDNLDVAAFARSLTRHGGGHKKAAGASLNMSVAKATELVLRKLEAVFTDAEEVPFKIAA